MVVGIALIVLVMQGLRVPARILSSARDQVATEAVPSGETEQTELNEPIACSCTLRRAEPMSEQALQ